MAKFYLATQHHTGMKCALKFIEAEDNAEWGTICLNSIPGLRHRNIVRLMDRFMIA